MHSIILIITMALVTMLTRFLPFIIFKDNIPNYIKYLGRVLPTAIIGMLVVYCLKDLNITNHKYALREIMAVLLVVFLQTKTRNSIVSIIGGTIIYMIFC